MSPDGYIRVPLASLNAMSFIHLFSQSDDDFLRELRAQTVPACSAGFSEWKSETEPPISLGWGWFVHSQSRHLLLAPDGIRSNVMLIDTCGYDLGVMKTSHLFGMWLNDFDWQGTVGMSLRDAIAC